jgi:hypothetical protein
MGWVVVGSGYFLKIGQKENPLSPPCGKEDKINKKKKRRKK